MTGNGKHQHERDLYSLLHNVSTRMGRGPRQGLSVRPGQNKVLSILNEHDSMHQQDLLAKLGIRAGSLSELLRKLENDGYITRHRDEENKSRIVVEITEKGRISALERELSRKERDEELFGQLSAAEKEELSALLVKLLDIWTAQDELTVGERRESHWAQVEREQDRARSKQARGARHQHTIIR